MRSIRRTHADVEVLARVEIAMPSDPIVKRAAEHASITQKTRKNPELNNPARENKQRSKNQITVARKTCAAVVADFCGRKPIIVHPRVVELSR